MDVHNSLPDGAAAEDVAKAHEADLATQDKYGVRYLNSLDGSGQREGVLSCRGTRRPMWRTPSTEAHGLVADGGTPGGPGLTCWPEPVASGFATLDERRFPHRNG